MLVKQALAHKGKSDLDIVIDEERQTVAHDLVQFEASVQDLSATLEHMLKHPLRSVKQAIEPVNLAGLAISKRPFRAVGYAVLTGLGAGLFIFDAHNAKKSKIAPISALQSSNLAQNIGGVIKSELTRLAMVSLSHFLGNVREKVSPRKGATLN